MTNSGMSDVDITTNSDDLQLVLIGKELILVRRPKHDKDRFESTNGLKSMFRPSVMRVSNIWKTLK